MTSSVGAGLYLNPGETEVAKIVQVVRQLIEGRSNAVFTATLNASSTITSVTGATIGPTSILLWQPTTANAAAQMTVLRTTSVAPLVAYLAHGNNVNSDQTFNFLAIG